MGVNMWRWVLGACLLCLAAACSTAPKPIGLEPSIRSVAGAMPVPSPADYTSPTRNYYIGPNDILNIEVFGVSELKRDIQVDGSGRISFPLIGVIEAGGLQPNQLAQQIETRLAGTFVKNPQVTVNLKETSGQLVTVDGQVVRPGMYPVAGQMTLQRAVAVAGGTTEFAKVSDVVVRRNVGGQTYIALYDLGAIRRGNYADPEIFPLDVVVVGDSPERRMFRDVFQTVPALLSPLVLLVQ